MHDRQKLDRRKIPRKDLKFFMAVFDRQTEGLLGYLANLSDDGLQLIGEMQFYPGVIYQISVDLPQETFPEQKLLLEVQSVWCQPDAEKDLFISGFRLVNLTETAQGLVTRLLQEFVIP